MSLSPPPALPPPVLHLPSPVNNSFPVIAIAVIGILATAFLLISYYIFVIKCCLTWHRVDFFNRFFSRVRDPHSNDNNNNNNNSSSLNDNTAVVEKGLDEALIRSIPVIEFRKLLTKRRTTTETNTTASSAAAVEAAASYECAVCLCEFEEGERLRVIPYCCHAFHIDCIDVWLQSNANCPLCRSGISAASILHNAQPFLMNNNYPPSNPPQKPLSEEDDHNDNDDDDDYVVIEIEGNNLDEPRLVNREAGRNKRMGRVCSMGDELIIDMLRKKDDEFFGVVQPIRRSISMDLSNDREFCLEIRDCCRSNLEATQPCEVSSSSSNSKVKKSIFSFGYARTSRCSVQPVHLDS